MEVGKKKKMKKGLRQLRRTMDDDKDGEEERGRSYMSKEGRKKRERGK